MQRRLDKGVIHADSTDFDAEFLDSEFLHEFLLDGLPCFRAQAAHAFVSVVARKRRQVHAGDRSQKPCRLPFFLDSSASNLRLRATFHGARVHPNFLHPVQIERNAGVRKQRNALRAWQSPVDDWRHSRTS